MNAFEIHINGEKICTAGVPPTHGAIRGQLAVRLLAYSDRDTAGVSAAGGDAETGERLGWTPAMFRVGDEVTIRLIKTEVTDPPERRVPPLQKGETHLAPGFNPPYPQPTKQTGDENPTP